jgi:hypothetical protein
MLLKFFGFSEIDLSFNSGRIGRKSARPKQSFIAKRTFKNRRQDRLGRIFADKLNGPGPITEQRGLNYKITIPVHFLQFMKIS